LSRIKWNSIIWAYLTHWQGNLCATLGTHCHPWQSHLIIIIMAAGVHLHTGYLSTPYFQIKTHCIICKKVFDYEHSQIFGMSCYICIDQLHYFWTMNTFFLFLSTWKCSIYYVHILSTNFVLLLRVMFILTLFQELCEETTFYYLFYWLVFLHFDYTLNGFCLFWLSSVLGLNVFSRTWESLQIGRVLYNQSSILVKFYCINGSMKKKKIKNKHMTGLSI
jgi:hypothetical protein